MSRENADVLRWGGQQTTKEYLNVEANWAGRQSDERP
jgi:hypothetical protein